jgi:hypothetical protein
VAGVDSRFKAAVPVYGCGFLHENSAWLDRFAKMTQAQRERWITLWDPSRYLPAKQLCITVNMPHSHPAGWAPKEIGLFIDQHLREGSPLPTVGDPERQNGTIRVSYSSPVKLADAALHVTTDKGPINKRTWQTHKAKIDGNAIVSESSVRDATAWFLTVTNDRGAVVSTRVRILPEIRVETDVAVPMSDGTILRANIHRPDLPGS